MNYKKPIYKALYSVACLEPEFTTCMFQNAATGELSHYVFSDDQVTIEEIAAWVNGEKIQNAMPRLSTDYRELFLTGGMYL